MEKIRPLQKADIDSLRSLMLGKNFTEEEINIQLNKLNQIVLLSSVSRLAKSKGIDLASLNFIESQDTIDWLTTNFTEQEIAEALFEESKTTLEQYLKIINS